MDLKKLHCFLKWAFPSSIHVWGWRCPQKLLGEELEHQEILGIQAGGTSSPFARLIEITSLWQNPFPSNFTSFFPWSPRVWGVLVDNEHPGDLGNGKLWQVLLMLGVSLSILFYFLWFQRDIKSKCALSWLKVRCCRAGGWESCSGGGCGIAIKKIP